MALTAKGITAAVQRVPVWLVYAVGFVPAVPPEARELFPPRAETLSTAGAHRIASPPAEVN